MAPNISVRVSIFDVETNQLIGETDLTSSQLPETFEQLETTLHLGDADWVVVNAIPTTRAEFQESGRLELHLRRVEYVDPKTILFSLPSITDWLPRAGTQPCSGNELMLHEDDWRQLELVLASHAEVCLREIASIRRIHEEESAEVGWRKIHVRDHPEPPIDRRITTEDVIRIFGLSKPLGTLAFERSEFVIEDGWSFKAHDNQQFYGVETDGKISVFGIVQESLPETPSSSIANLKQLASEFALQLVHWNRCTLAPPSDALFERILVVNAGADCGE